MPPVTDYPHNIHPSRATRSREDSPWLAFCQRLVRDVMDFALPSACLGCENDLHPLLEGRGGSQTPLRLCRQCRSLLKRHGPVRCRHCARPVAHTPSPSRTCSPCSRSNSALDDLLTCFDYREPFDQVIRAFKFGGFRVLAKPLAREIWDLHAERLNQADVFVPVPSHWKRQLGRGFNPPYEIARHLGRLSQKPVRQPLQRLAGPPQSKVALDQRRRNARRAFVWRNRRGPGRGWSLEGASRVLLIDDVTTTRATLESCARLLKRHGAQRVTAACLGWTPPPDP